MLFDLLEEFLVFPPINGNDVLKLLGQAKKSSVSV